MYRLRTEEAPCEKKLANRARPTHVVVLVAPECVVVSPPLGVVPALTPRRRQKPSFLVAVLIAHRRHRMEAGQGRAGSPHDTPSRVSLVVLLGQGEPDQTDEGLNNWLLEWGHDSRRDD